jgi:hypothetical protein
VVGESEQQMTQPGVVIKRNFPGRFVLGGETFKANISFGLSVDISFSYWEDGTYTIYEAKLKVPGHLDIPLPLGIRDSLYKDENFKKMMQVMIKDGL